MTQFLYDAIKAIAGEDINIGAQITDVDGNNITSGCSLLFIDKDFHTIAEYAGTYADGEFVIKSREPSAEEKAADEAEAKRKAEYVSPEQRIKELEDALDALLSGRVE